MMCCAYMFFSSCSLQAYKYAEYLYNNYFTVLRWFCALNYTNPPTHFTQAPPSPSKNRYLNSRLMILHAIIYDASELATELFYEVQSPRCTFAISITTAKLPAWSRHVQGIT